MKVLVSTKETQKQRINDFSWVPEGELVTFGSECGRGSVDDHCGCRRSMVGVECMMATTTMKVVERPELTSEKLEEAILSSLVAGGWYEADDPEAKSWARSAAEELIRLASAFSEGNVVEKRDKKFQQRIPKEMRSIA